MLGCRRAVLEIDFARKELREPKVRVDTWPQEEGLGVVIALSDRDVGGNVFNPRIQSTHIYSKSKSDENV